MKRTPSKLISVEDDQNYNLSGNYIVNNIKLRSRKIECRASPSSYLISKYGSKILKYGLDNEFSADEEDAEFSNVERKSQYRRRIAETSMKSNSCNIESKLFKDSSLVSLGASRYLESLNSSVKRIQSSLHLAKENINWKFFCLLMVLLCFTFAGLYYAQNLESSIFIRNKSEKVSIFRNIKELFTDTFLYALTSLKNFFIFIYELLCLLYKRSINTLSECYSKISNSFHISTKNIFIENSFYTINFKHFTSSTFLKVYEFFSYNFQLLGSTIFYIFEFLLTGVTEILIFIQTLSWGILCTLFSVLKAGVLLVFNGIMNIAYLPLAAVKIVLHSNTPQYSIKNAESSSESTLQILPEHLLSKILSNPLTHLWFEEKFREKTKDIVSDLDDLRKLNTVLEAENKEKLLKVDELHSLENEINEIVNSQHKVTLALKEVAVEVETLKGDQTESNQNGKNLEEKLSLEITKISDRISLFQTESSKLENLLKSCCEKSSVVAEKLNSEYSDLSAEFSIFKHNYAKKHENSHRESAQILANLEELKKDFIQRLEDRSAELNDSVLNEIEKLRQLQKTKSSENIDATYSVNEAQLRELIRSAINVYDADKTAKFDYAMLHVGGSVLTSSCTEPYTNRGMVGEIMGLPFKYSGNNDPNLVISPGNMPGQCYAFKGSQGHFMIKLREPIKITGVAMEHISKNLSPKFSITSAPKNFSVTGLNATEEKGVFLGNFTYLDNGETLQHFNVKFMDTSFKYVSLNINSNHGNMKYTCLYRFRVHGEHIHD